MRVDCIIIVFSYYHLISGSCLFLDKKYSAVYAYSCRSFQYGCHNSPFPSNDLFKRKSQGVMYLT